MHVCVCCVDQSVEFLSEEVVYVLQFLYCGMGTSVVTMVIGGFVVMRYKIMIC
jgi:hypothetical protein